MIGYPYLPPPMGYPPMYPPAGYCFNYAIPPPVPDVPPPLSPRPCISDAERRAIYEEGFRDCMDSMGSVL
jgi:hypothetical protein